MLLNELKTLKPLKYNEKFCFREKNQKQFYETKKNFCSPISNLNFNLL